jgi:hypothetical protein
MHPSLYGNFMGMRAQKNASAWRLAILGSKRAEWARASLLLIFPYNIGKQPVSCSMP